ncbi:MAG TPA: potassium-transporting ATPase subunit KdpC [Anaeromyxobacteraceae bacterium]|nr:potassium-transporting ATPase subunit KdpC [Anaeromyxobacteraceae bacterium]
MREHLLPALRATVVTLVLTGVLYPLAVTGVAQVLFPRRASGSLVSTEGGRVVGSELIAQGFSGPGYFQPRPSAAGDKGYDPMSSGGSNLGPTSKKLHDGVAQAVDKLRADNPGAPGPVPVELATASGSGLDPHLSPQAALWQVARVARARGVAESRVRAAVQDAVEGRDAGIFGEPRVNVLLLNLQLDRQFGAPGTPGSGYH